MKNEKKFTILEISLFLAFIMAVTVSSFSSVGENCREIRENVLRLHVIANSDSEDDQNLKLKVRDAVLSAGSSLFDGTTDTETAVAKAQTEADYLTDAAQKVISENGFDYKAEIEVGKSYFPTREYDNITLPAGEYTAVRVILGKGEGHNWWCVMFPPLCLPAAENKTELSDVLSDSAVSFAESGKKYEIKFKIVEWYEELKMKFVSR